MYTGFVAHRLDAKHALFEGRLPDQRLPNLREKFDALWAMHPEERHEIVMYGKKVLTPRWQQAYGKDYRYSQRTNTALSLTPYLDELLTNWVRPTIDERLNGALLNWYDGSQSHYIGRHRDSTKGLVEGAPIVTISLGDTRVFRLRAWRPPGPALDFQAIHGTVFVMPWDTNLAWTHEVPASEQHRGRRLSITFRAFRD